MKARSSHERKKTLNWWDLIWFGIGTVIGSGIFVLTGLEAKTEAGPTVVLSYVVPGVSALYFVFCYTVEIPVAGSFSRTLAFIIYLLGSRALFCYLSD
uniref:Amino acid permease yfnA n=1 Tax=Cajanus cajan TaxID=3821 RepID=A0A151S3X4_CAJCA|nr:putative amino acid permease yfnA [Cajanus cajan]